VKEVHATPRGAKVPETGPQPGPAGHVLLDLELEKLSLQITCRRTIDSESRSLGELGTTIHRIGHIEHLAK